MHSDIGFAGPASAGFFDFKAFFFGAVFITKTYQIQKELTISFRLKKKCIIIMMSYIRKRQHEKSDPAYRTNQG
jgi:hypothetical protein